MKTLVLGKTGLTVTKTALGCLPLQRCTEADAVDLIRAAFDGGITYFDTANAYSDSEKKLGLALSGVRSRAVISTKSGGADKKTVTAHIENSLRLLRTDYIDLLQFHNPAALPDPDDPDGPWAAAREAKEKGYVRHIGITEHRLPLAEAAIESGLYETLQFPMSYLSSERELALAEKCRARGMGFIAMKGLAGGLLGRSPRACHAFMKQYPSAANIWGMQTRAELDQWLALAREDPDLDDELRAVIAADRAELSGSFCRSCGYCLPCTVGIEIFNCARMDMLLRRSPWQQYMTPEWQGKMERIRDCVDCRLCASRCPYGLDTPNVLRSMLKDYENFRKEKGL